jgi:hypothetical protein
MSLHIEYKNDIMNINYNGLNKSWLVIQALVYNKK